MDMVERLAKQEGISIQTLFWRGVCATKLKSKEQVMEYRYKRYIAKGEVPYFMHEYCSRHLKEKIFQSTHLVGMP